MNFDSDLILPLLLSGIMGIIGGFISTPINAMFSFWLKRDEIKFQSQLDFVNKQRILLFEHRLEMERKQASGLSHNETKH